MVIDNVTCVLRGSGLAALMLVSVAARAAPVPASIIDAVADLSRPQLDRGRDAALKPEQVIAFAGIEYGDKVADFMPGSGYSSRILCNVVGDSGHVYAISLGSSQASRMSALEPAETLAPACGNVSYLTLQLKKKPAPELWSSSDDPGVVYEYWSFSPPAENFAVPEALDMIWVADHYHDLHTPALGSPNMQLVIRALWNALKPGGVLIIQDHVAAARSGTRDAPTLHRIEPAHVKREVIAAGFQYVSASSVLRHRRDPHTRDAHEMGDEADRFLLKFRRPQ